MQNIKAAFIAITLSPFSLSKSKPPREVPPPRINALCPCQDLSGSSSKNGLSGILIMQFPFILALTIGLCIVICFNSMMGIERGQAIESNPSQQQKVSPKLRASLWLNRNQTLGQPPHIRSGQYPQCMIHISSILPVRLHRSEYRSR